MERMLVSRCLLGCKCAYDGRARDNVDISAFLELIEPLPVCPEMDGGLGCPRERHEIRGGNGFDVLNGTARVLSRAGKDRTDCFLRGAHHALRKVEDHHIRVALLKSGSPSCGPVRIHAGFFDGSMRNGPGVTAAILMSNSVRVFPETEIKELIGKELPG